MAEIELTDEQQQQMENLMIALDQDEALRERLQEDPRTVLGAYGLAEIVPAAVQFEISPEVLEVAGFAAKLPSTHLDKPIHFDKTTHVDSGVALGGVRVQIGPTFGTLG